MGRPESLGAQVVLEDRFHVVAFALRPSSPNRRGGVGPALAVSQRARSSVLIIRSAVGEWRAAPTAAMLGGWYAELIQHHAGGRLALANAVG